MTAGSPVTRADLSADCYAGCGRPRLPYGAFCRQCDGTIPDEPVVPACVAPIRCYCPDPECRERLKRLPQGVGTGGTDLKASRRLAGQVETTARRAMSGPSPAAHHAAGPTTHAAAERLSGAPVGRIRLAVFVEFARAAGNGLTDDECEQLTGRPHQTVSSARNALVSLGYLCDSGRTRPTRSGFKAAVWWVSPAARHLIPEVAGQDRL